MWKIIEKKRVHNDIDLMLMRKEKNALEMIRFASMGRNDEKWTSNLRRSAHKTKHARVPSIQLLFLVDSEMKFHPLQRDYYHFNTVSVKSIWSVSVSIHAKYQHRVIHDIFIFFFHSLSIVIVSPTERLDDFLNKLTCRILRSKRKTLQPLQP